MFTVLFILAGCNKAEEISLDEIQYFEIGDLRFAIAHKFVGRGSYKKGEFLALDFSLPSMNIYNEKLRKRDHLRIIIKKKNHKEPSLIAKQAIRVKAFGATLSDEQTYPELDFYKANNNHLYDYFVSRDKNVPILVFCYKDTGRVDRTPMCDFTEVMISPEVQVTYFYPRASLYQWKNHHKKIMEVLSTIIKEK